MKKINHSISFLLNFHQKFKTIQFNHVLNFFVKMLFTIILLLEVPKFSSFKNFDYYSGSKLFSFLLTLLTLML